MPYPSVHLEPPNQTLLEFEEDWLRETGNRLPEERILNLFWLKETVFTRRHQMGILAGMLINIYYGITHVIH
ncbi:hypothetical protein BY458DRAFT_430209 [Sporodiniella umbellata]|nr:hypothetical protein BY458DRAFT_430209 [Sporodiniella umbellata]